MHKLELGINKCSNSEYHSDQEYLSSSDLKLLLKDPREFFHKKYSKKEIEPENPAFSEGSLVHSMLLEEHMVDLEFAFMDIMRKSGPLWEAFKTSNPGKVCMSKPQYERCKAYADGAKKNPIAKRLLTGGDSEFTICQIINDVAIKVRADKINIEQGFIADVKTSSFPVDLDSFSLTINQYNYRLSAALYCLVAEQFYGKKFDFYFIAISKKDASCEVFKMSEQSFLAGRREITQAINTYKSCKASGNWLKSEKGIYVPNEEILEV